MSSDSKIHDLIQTKINRPYTVPASSFSQQALIKADETKTCISSCSFPSARVTVSSTYIMILSLPRENLLSWLV